MVPGFTVKEQGLADSGSNPNFSFENKLDHYGSYFEFPSLNKAIFAENLVRINDCISITPGFRYDRIELSLMVFFMPWLMIAYITQIIKKS